jgi:hypothetical protein
MSWPLERADGPRGQLHRQILSLVPAVRSGRCPCSHPHCRQAASSIVMTLNGERVARCKVHAGDARLDRRVLAQRRARAEMRGL